MFKGVVHANTRMAMADFIPHLPKKVVSICAGNFTVETTIRMNGYKGQLESCDVSPYSCSLGEYLSGQARPFDLAADAPAELDVFRKHMTEPEGVAASVAVLLDLADHAKQQNQFERRYYRAIVRDADRLIAGTRLRLQKKKALVQLNQFHTRDGVKVIDDLKGQSDALIMSFPPTYSGGYEKLYARLAQWLKWEIPEYTDLSHAGQLAQLMIGSGCRWILLQEERKPEIEEIVGKPVVQASRGHEKNVYLYSSIRVSPKLVRREIKCAPEPNWIRLSDKDEITEKSVIGITKIDCASANYIRQLYSSHKPIQGAAQWAFVFTIDGKIFGLTMWSLVEFGLNYKEKDVGDESVYMMCDLPVSSERHKRLSKLVLACTLSREFGQAMSSLTTQRIGYVFTTAFSSKPASMKYLGIFDKMKAVWNEETREFGINYIGTVTNKSAQEQFIEWFHKHYAK